MHKGFKLNFIYIYIVCQSYYSGCNILTNQIAHTYQTYKLFIIILQMQHAHVQSKIN